MELSELPSTDAWATATGYINFVASHELRIVLAGVVDSGMVGEGFGLQQLGNAVVRLQDSDPYWSPKVGHGNHLITGRNGLRAICLDQMDDPARPGAKLWRSRPEGRELRLALGGLFGSLSLDYPNISTRRLLGEGLAKPSRVQEPEARYMIFRELVDIDVPEIWSIPHIPRPSAALVKKYVHALTTDNILVTEARDTNPLLEVYDADDFLGWRPADHWLKATINALLRENKGRARMATVEQITNKVCRTYRDAPRETVSGYLLARLENNASAPIRGLRLYDRRMPRLAGLSPYTSLTPAVSKIIEDMVGGVEGLVRDENVQEYTAKARVLLRSPAAVKALLRKEALAKNAGAVDKPTD